MRQMSVVVGVVVEGRAVCTACTVLYCTVLYGSSAPPMVPDLTVDHFDYTING